MTSPYAPPTPTADHEDEHDDFGGMHRDLPTLVGRRRALQVFGGVGLAGVLVACGNNGGTAATSTTSATTAASSTTAGDATTTTAGSAGSVVAAAGEEIPSETAGPYPADGSNGPNVLDESGIVRTDIRTSIGDMSGTATGVSTNFQLTILDAATGDAMPGAAVYLWHCTATGQYSIYEVTDQNYLRGVAVADDAGLVSFESIYPGCYQGRWPHAHFEVYSSVDEATAGSQAVRTSQLALPQDTCETVYASGDYGNSASNLSRLSLDTDGIFRDGWEDQLMTISGDASSGYTASLLVRI